MKKQMVFGSVLMFFVVVLFISCGGGGGSESTPVRPSPPGGVTAAKGDGSCTVSWNNVTGATGYNLYYSTTTDVKTDIKNTGTKIPGTTSPETVDGLIRGVPVFFVVTAENAGGESDASEVATATPDPPVPTYSQIDLEGKWNVQVILSGTTSGWYRFTADVDGSGNVTISDNTSSPGVTVPPISNWSITAGTGTDNTAGMVTETGVDNNSTFHGKMSSSKNLIAGVSTFGVGTSALHVFLKRDPLVTYDNTDLMGKDIVYNRIYTGDSNDWEIANGSIDGTGEITLDPQTISGNVDVIPPNLPHAATISVTSEGVVSITNEDFSGILSIDKKVIVGTSTDVTNPNPIYSLRIMQLRGQTYSLADLEGTYVTFALHSEPVSSWAYAEWSINDLGDVSVADIFNSDGSIGGPDSWNYSLDPDGVLSETAKDSTHGFMTFGKDMTVITTDYGSGSSLIIMMQ